MAICRAPLLWTLAASSLLLAPRPARGFAIPRSAYQARQVADVAELLPAYDYVIVGGGTAGLTVADRLTEDPGTKVLVLESGIFADPAVVLPATGGGTFRQPGHIFDSAPQENLNGKSFSVTIGNMVGGSSGANAMMTARGSAEDYDRWAKPFSEDDQEDWSWKGMLPYFKKAFTFTPPPEDIVKRFNITYDTSYWGNDGPVHVSFPDFQYPGLDPLISAFSELPNIEMNIDSGAGGAGLYWFPSFMDPVRHERSYALNGHYENLNRPNYHIMPETPGRRVLLENGTATGVEFTKDGQLSTIKADKEVILSAGAVFTPKILQGSGIGPQNILEAAGIETLVDLPGVGQNFHDHYPIRHKISLPGLLNIHPNSYDLSNDASFRQQAEDLWAANRTGPYSIAYGNVAGWLPLTAIAPARYSELADELEALDYASSLSADVHPTIVQGYAMQMKGLATAMRSKDTVFGRFYVNATVGATDPILNQVLSRGSININTTDPYSGWPVVDYRALSNPVERKIAVEMVRWFRRYNFDTSLAALGPTETAPGLEIDTDEEIADWLTEGLNPTDRHPVGTSAMMPLELGGVVDTTLRVYGVKGLRVVDASIIPIIPGGNVCQPTYAIAEKAAEIIKSKA